MVRPNLLSTTRFTRLRFEVALQLLLFIVVGGVIYRYCWLDITDPYKCGALLNKGQWLDPGPKWTSRKTFQNWQPPGCIMHEYKKKDIEICLRGSRMVFIGDSTTRQVFWAVVKKLDRDRAEQAIERMLDSKEKHNDIDFESNGVTVQFKWDPWLNSTALERELKTFRAHPSRANDEVELGKEASGSSAASVLLGTPGLWYARHGQENFFKNFRNAIDVVIPYMDHGPDDNEALPLRPISRGKQSPNLLLFAPVQVPDYEFLSPAREETIIPEKIDQMNDYLQQVSAHSFADVIWSYSLMTWRRHSAYEESGLHVVENVAHRKADVLLNLRCNANSANVGYPFDKTCCSNYRILNTTQWTILVMGMLILPILPFLQRRHIARVSHSLPSTNVLNALTIIVLVVCYCFYADRTQIFEKAHKQFRRHEFFWACAVVAIGGISTVRRNSGPRTGHSSARIAGVDGFLSRDQTDEWKGWMQFFILIYHYTHGSTILPIYYLVRLSVASYLFLMGFGHTLYLLEKDDFSSQRIIQVLLRLNLISCILPYMMSTDYLFYYFAPLASFWFLVIYTTLRLGRSRNSSLVFLIGKVILSAMLTMAFTMIPGILEFVSLFLRYTCRISWNISEWRFRTFLDMYIVYIGILVAIFFARIRKLKSINTPPSTMIDKILSFTVTYNRLYKAALTIWAIGIISGFWAISSVHTKKEDFNWWHPYLSFLPILAFIALRNCHDILQSYHSGLFAWLGRFSLESYILQCHIWLAGDTRGLLRLGLWNQWVEAAMLTVIFLWLSYLVANATQVLTHWILGYSTNREAFRGRDSKTAAKVSPYLLPRDQDEGCTPTPSKDMKFELRKTRFSQWLPQQNRITLQWKVVWILTLMWIGNIAYKQ
ncbi:10 TM acyl transferase domain found in Cas1p-domain-containing protein [Tricladium varicosporioides]|nr:10 TM acyl transferase domain found in Cas1p-domain-containing protein [Hymenoscyphus varicosporioides]